MSFVRWTVFILFWGAVAAVLHYTLPQHDLVRINDTENRRIDPGVNSWFWANSSAGANPQLETRDVFFISGVRPDGSVIVYRNEDTAWSWPPYLKFNSSNLQAQSADMTSTAAEPNWVMIRHYGWRTELFSIFPNATAVWEVAGPDVSVFNWRAIGILAALAALYWYLYTRWRRFRESRIDPMLEDMGDGLADASGALGERTGRFKRWLRGA